MDARRREDGRRCRQTAAARVQHAGNRPVKQDGGCVGADDVSTEHDEGAQRQIACGITDTEQVQRRRVDDIDRQ